MTIKTDVEELKGQILQTNAKVNSLERSDTRNKQMRCKHNRISVEIENDGWAGSIKCTTCEKTISSSFRFFSAWLYKVLLKRMNNKK